MTNLEQFERYANAFEQTMIDDDWSRLGEYFAVHATYEPGDGRVGEGREGVVEALRQGVVALDRRFSAREIVETNLREADGVVTLSFRACYRDGDLPPLVIEGEERAYFEQGEIVRLEDSIPAETVAAMDAWFAAWGDRLGARRTKRVIIFGATGSIGRSITEQALDAGYEVTAFARRAAGLDIQHRNLNVVNGDVFDAAQVEAAIRGHDAVIYAVGAGMKGNVRARGTVNVIRGMQHSGVRRLIALSTLGVGDSWSHLNFVWKYLMFGMLLRSAFVDHQLQEDIIRQADLDWTIIRPSAFVDELVEGEVRVGSLDGEAPLALKIPRKVLADFFVKQVEDVAWLRGTPAISC